MRSLVLLVFAVVGCAYAPTVELTPGAPHLEPSAKTEAVAVAPAGAVRIGTVTVQSNNHQSGQGCEATALYEAKKIGATHAVIRPSKSGWGKGPKCIGEAYYLAPK